MEQVFQKVWVLSVESRHNQDADKRIWLTLTIIMVVKWDSFSFYKVFLSVCSIRSLMTCMLIFQISEYLQGDFRKANINVVEDNRSTTQKEKFHRYMIVLGREQIVAKIW